MEKDGLFFRSGDLFLNKRMRKFLETFLYGSYESNIYITYWSVLHFISGILVALILRTYMPHIQHPYSVGFAGHTLWEGWQVYIGMSLVQFRTSQAPHNGASRPWNWKGHNGFTDLVMDSALFMAGMYAYNWLA